MSKETAYHWFQGDSVEELFARLSAAGPATARLEVHQRDEKMYLVVRRTGNLTTMDDPDPINDSHRCPPSCP